MGIDCAPKKKQSQFASREFCWWFSWNLLIRAFTTYLGLFFFWAFHTLELYQGFFLFQTTTLPSPLHVAPPNPNSMLASGATNIAPWSPAKVWRPKSHLGLGREPRQERTAVSFPGLEAPLCMSGGCCRQLFGFLLLIGPFCRGYWYRWQFGLSGRTESGSDFIGLGQKSPD